MSYRYRDTQTGRFVSRATWRRSKAQDGTRYKRQTAVPPSRRMPRVPRPPERAVAPAVVRKPKRPRREAPKVMYRVSVGVTYPWRTKDKRGRPGKGRYMAFVVTGWYTSAKSARAAIPSLKRRAWQGLKAALGYEAEEWWFSFKKGLNIEEPTAVTYDRRFLDTVEERDEGKDERK